MDYNAAPMKQIPVQTTGRTHFVEITAALRKLADDAGWTDGVMTVFVPHTTAGVTINEHADPDVMRDMETVLDHLVPWTGNYRHGEGNTAAHVKASLMGSSARVILEGGRPRLGTWQGVFLCEFDGPRTREVWVTFTA
jgi:secondary thiamine-phosphate synthase enzyme